MNRIMAITSLLGLALFSLGCGAPSKSAGDVAYLFSDSSTASLSEKVVTSCEELRARQAAPTLRDVTLDTRGCNGAGTAAPNLKATNSFYFVGLDEGLENASGDVIEIDVRSQVWLNRSLLGLASLFAGKMKEAKAKGEDNVGLLQLPDSGGAIENIVDVQLNVVEKPDFDIDELKFSTRLDVQVRFAGYEDEDIPEDEIPNIAKLDIQVDGMLLNNNIVATVKNLTPEPDYEKSIVRDFEVVALVVPHAGDMYLDLFVGLEVNSPTGDEGQEVIRQPILQFLSTGVKQIIDGVLTLQ